MSRRGIPYLPLLLVIPLGVLWYSRGYGEIRHILSWVGVGCLVLALSYFARVHWVSWGRRTTWLRWHRPLSLVGTGIILLHTTLRSYSWHASLASGGVLIAASTGIWLNTRRTESRRRWRQLHLAVMPLLLISVIVHAFLRPRHDAYMPLESPHHKVACAGCHVSDRSYRTNTCLGCHPHNAPNVFETHALHGIGKEQYAPCLDCHIAEIRGEKYGRARAPGYARIDWVANRRADRP